LRVRFEISEMVIDIVICGVKLGVEGGVLTVCQIQYSCVVAVLVGLDVVCFGVDGGFKCVDRVIC